MHGNTQQPTNLVLNKLGVVSSLYGTTLRKHRLIEHQPSFHFAEQLQPGFSCLLSSGSDSVLYSKFLCHVSGSSSRIARVVPVQRCCLEENPSRPSISFPWAVLCVVDFLSLILVDHSAGKTHEKMKRRQVLHTSTSNDFHAALFVDDIFARQSASARSETAPYSTQILPNPHYLFNYESVSCRNVAKTF